MRSGSPDNRAPRLGVGATWGRSVDGCPCPPQHGGLRLERRHCNKHAARWVRNPDARRREARRERTRRAPGERLRRRMSPATARSSVATTSSCAPARSRSASFARARRGGASRRLRRHLAARPQSRTRARADGLSDADMRAMLDDHGVAVAEIEVLNAWRPGVRVGRSAPSADEVFAVASGGRRALDLRRRGSRRAAARRRGRARSSARCAIAAPTPAAAALRVLARARRSTSRPRRRSSLPPTVRTAA